MGVCKAQRLPTAWQSCSHPYQRTGRVVEFEKALVPPEFASHQEGTLVLSSDLSAVESY